MPLVLKRRLAEAAGAFDSRKKACRRLKHFCFYCSHFFVRGRSFFLKETLVEAEIWCGVQNEAPLPVEQPVRLVEGKDAFSVRKSISFCPSFDLMRELSIRELI